MKNRLCPTCGDVIKKPDWSYCSKECFDLRKQKKKPLWIHKADNGYIFDRRIFWGVMFIWILFIVLNGNYFNWNFDYHVNINCTNPNGCTNIFKDGSYLISPEVKCTDMWCEDMYLQGFNGTPLPWFYNWFAVICIVSLCCGFIINHKVWNTGKTIGLRLAVSDNTWEKIKKIKLDGVEDVENKNNK